MKQFTTLDTHVDARDILSPAEIDYTSKELYQVGANVKKKYSSAEYHNLDIYQINTTFYSALGDDDQKYFMARLLQVFAPGIPQVYYVGMLAGKNDIELLEKTKEGRQYQPALLQQGWGWSRSATSGCSIFIETFYF